MTAKLNLKTWTAPNGAVRRYVNNVAEIIGLVVNRYNTGNISSAYLNGECISNAAAGRILGAKIWIDAQDQVHVDRWAEWRTITGEQAAELVTAAYKADLAAEQAAAEQAAAEQAAADIEIRRETVAEIIEKTGPAPRRFLTLAEVIDRVVIPALGFDADDYDHEAIAAATHAYRVDTDHQGNTLQDSGGFEQVVSDDEFWEIVGQHDRTTA